jgi:glycerol-3-phosphate acyltransferase PlsY
MIKLILSALVAYLLGDISPAILISKALGGDIREKGSGNAGSTNMLRNYGKKAAIATLAIDVLKGVAAVKIGGLLAGAGGAYIAAVFVMIGHIWPAFFGFKGGKGVATALGTLLAVDWRMALIVLVFALAIMAISKMVSLGSVCAAAALPPLSFFMLRGFTLYGLVMAAIVIFKHRSNIKRILDGTESKLDFSKYK